MRPSKCEMSRLGRVTPSAGRDVIDRKPCFLSLLAQAAVWLRELRVSRTFLDKLQPQLLSPWIHNSTPCQTFCPRSGRFRLRELRVSRTFLDYLRLICSVHGYPARHAANTSGPRSDHFQLRELRVSRTFLDNLRLICSDPIYVSSVQSMDTTTRRPANTSCPRSGRFRLLELRVSRTFLGACPSIRP